MHTFFSSHNLIIAAESIIMNKTRALLTSLGIVFGVASVIAMLAIGEGAQAEILEQMKLLGTNNIIVKPIIEQEESTVEAEEAEKKEKKRFSPGLTLADAYAIRRIIPHVQGVSPEIISETTFLRSGLKRTGKLIGVDTAFFHDKEFEVKEGHQFSDIHIRLHEPVCVIGHGVRTKFFSGDDPIGKQIKCGNEWLTVIGVLKERIILEKQLKDLGIRDYNLDIYTPVTTMLLKFTNRSFITEKSIRSANASYGNDEEKETNNGENNFHQLDRMIIRIDNSDYISTIADITRRMLQRRHNDVVDFEIIVPELLLQQEQRTKTIFNFVLGAIASISLLVGGIGIMNIMLASVLERTKEIGIRRAIGARRADVVTQFLSEAVAISLTGGIVGIILGVSISYGIEKFADIKTIVTMSSIMISFGVSFLVGISFGYVPAQRAAQHDPIEALRYE